MTTTFVSAEFEMDFAHLDDKMEIGTSPYPQIDDIDFDFEPPRQQSIDRSMADDIETAGNITDAMQADADEVYKDDHMFDDEAVQQIYDHDHDHDLEDLNMESYDGENVDQQDEDILYDDEEIGSVDMTEQRNTEHVEDVETQVEYEGFHPETEDLVHSVDDSESSNQRTTNTVTDTNEINEFAKERTTAAISELESQASVPSITAARTGVIDFATQDIGSQLNAEVDLAESIDNTQAISSEELSEQQQSAAATQDFQSSSIEASVHETEESEEMKETQKDTNATTATISTNAPATALHPITVIYLGQEMSFFPPMMDDSSATFFLSDSNLAYEPVETLLTSCRDILGETLEHDDELVLDVPSLGLHICEDSKYASQITLAQVVDVYVNLSHNERLKQIEPLYCNLSSRVCLASQYAYLAASATEGKTYSEIAADYIDSPEHETEEIEERTNDQHAEVQQADKAEEGTSTEFAEADNKLESQHTQSGEGSEQTHPEQVADNPLNQKAESDHALDNVAQLAHSEIEFHPPEPKSAQVKEHGVVSTDSYHDSAIEIQPNPESKTVSPASEAQVSIEDEERTQASVQVHTHTDDELSNLQANLSPDSNNTKNKTVLDTEESLNSTSNATNKLEDSALPEDVGELQDELRAYDLPEDAFDEEDNEKLEADHQVPDDNPYQNQDEEFPAAVNEDTHDQAGTDNVEPEGFNLETVETGSTGNENADEEDELDLFPTDELTADAPITPSKPNGSKRKALDEEDELDFLDFDTPEPKRTRAS